MGGRVAVAPLHVLEPLSRTRLVLLDRWSQVEIVDAAKFLAVDRACDTVIFQTPSCRDEEMPRRFALGARPGTAVEIHAIVAGDVVGDQTSDRLAIRSSAVRDVVEVDCYTYQAASGQTVTVLKVPVLFLSEPFPLGWSGAPVYLGGTCDLGGFLHGNASANRGAGVCLLPGPSSPLLKILESRSNPSC